MSGSVRGAARKGRPYRDLVMKVIKGIMVPGLDI